MQIAILLFEHLTALDAVGPYEVLSRLPGAQTVFVGERLGPVRTDVGSLGLHVDATHMSDGPVHEWLRAADRTSTWTTSVCTGSLVLAAAGLLAGRRATTHWLAADQLAAWGAERTDERVVIDGKYVTAAGVSAGIDMGWPLSRQSLGRPRPRPSSWAWSTTRNPARRRLPADGTGAGRRPGPRHRGGDPPR